MNALAALCLLLTPRGMERTASALAFVAFDLLRLRRRLVLANLARAFGEPKDAAAAEERVRLARRSYYHFALTILEFVRGVREDIAAAIDIEGVEHARRALDEGRGAYILCIHLGNWEAMGAKISRAVAPAHVFVKKVGGDGTDRFVAEIRRRNGFLAVTRTGKGDGVKAALRALKRGEIVGFVMDQARPGEPRLPLFGHPAKTNTGLAAIWRRLPAPVLPALIRRRAPGRHVIEFLPPAALEATDDPAGDTLRNTARINAAVEDLVRRAPDQYFWMHDRWK